MAAAAREAGVPIVTGDTKVVEQGKGDGVFISTTGVGVVAPGVHISGRNARPGDVVLLSGSIGDHGVAVLSQRESLAFGTTIESDTAALHTLVAAMLAAAPGAVRVLRDPTRGGLATTLNEVARQSGVGMLLQEAAIPVKPQVDAACELLGLDPLYVANEGKLVAVVAPEVGRCRAGGDARASAGRRGGTHRRSPRRSTPLRPDGDPLWRPPHGGLAQRRTVAADLLKAMVMGRLAMVPQRRRVPAHRWPFLRAGGGVDAADV